MRSIDDHLALVRALARELPPEEVPLDEAGGRVIAADLTARLPVPPFTNSAMDGFAVHAADVTTPTTLDVVADIPAGNRRAVTVPAGSAARIMTGAPLPEGADAVVPVEATDQPRGAAPLPERVAIHEAVRPGRHVRRAGEDVSVGDPVVPRGTRVDAAVRATLASIGYARVPVHRRPRVLVGSTGDELVAPGEPLAPGEVHDSNSLLVEGLVERFGGEVAGRHRVSDDVRALEALLAEHAGDADVLVTTGGVSVGAFDVVRATLDADFHAVAMQPGKPQGAGRIDRDGHSLAFLGLPGNPVSVFVSAWVFLRELLGATAGHTLPWPASRVPSGAEWSSPAARTQYVPVRLEGGHAVPTGARAAASHHVGTLWQAEALAVVPAGVDHVGPGDELDVHMVR